MPMPESLAGYPVAVGAALEDSDTGGLGAGRLGIKLTSLVGMGPWPLPGTGGGARGFSKVPSFVTTGNLGLAGGLVIDDVPTVFGV